VPYEEGYEAIANEHLLIQARRISENLQLEGIEVAPETEIVAMIAYLQRLGKDIKESKTAENK
jgi:cytochrome c oxidase cbb3-type subunit I/II